MTTNYSEQLHNVLLYSTQEAERLGNDFVGPEHLLLGLLRNGKGKAIDILIQSNVDINKVKQTIESKIRTDKEPTGEAILTLKSTERIKKIMELETRSLSVEVADTEHLLLAILKEKNNLAVDTLFCSGNSAIAINTHNFFFLYQKCRRCRKVSITARFGNLS